MKQTTNYKLKKPEATDFYDVEDNNGNMDIIDQTMKANEQAASAAKKTAEDHVADKSNPHNVSKSDVGLSNVPNVSTNDQTPTYTQSGTLSNISSGEKLSVAMGKIAKAIADFITHKSDSVGHITSAERGNWNGKMDKVHPKGTGPFSFNRKSSTDIGPYSVAIGSNVTASGNKSFAEGSDTTASGDWSHAEGDSTTASGHWSHAEGHTTTASGNISHAEGMHTTASGIQSHAEGTYTIASSNYQHVQGKYNIEDTEGKYAHIIGGGTNSDVRKNIHTVDWEGNAEYAGGLKLYSNDESFGIEFEENDVDVSSGTKSRNAQLKVFNLLKNPSGSYKTEGNIEFGYGISETTCRWMFNHNISMKTYDAGSTKYYISSTGSIITGSNPTFVNGFNFKNVGADSTGNFTYRNEAMSANSGRFEFDHPVKATKIQTTGGADLDKLSCFGMIVANSDTAPTSTGVDTKIPLNSLKYANGFTAYNGGIKCPYDGYVHVDFSAFISPFKGYDGIKIYVNSSSKGDYFEGAHTQTYSCISSSRIIQVSAGDVIYLYGSIGTAGDTFKSTDRTNLLVHYVN